MLLSSSRWAAIGAAVAITSGAVGVGLVEADVTSGERTVFVPVTPCRIIDTRPAFQVGPRSTPLGTAETHVVSAHGTNGNCTIPSDAVGLSINVTAVGATLPTFLTIWATGAAMPNASNLNPHPGQPPIPNAVITELSADGRFSIYNLQGNVHVLADVNGYYAHHTHDDRYYTETEVDAMIAAIPAGPRGPAGDDGVDGADAPRPARVIWVATAGGDYTKLSTALAAINDASAANPYVIKIAPGVYTETAPVTLKDYVDVEGSGRDVTTISCACGGGAIFTANVLMAGAITAEVRHVTVLNTGGDNYSVGIATNAVGNGSFSLLYVTAEASGSPRNWGIYNWRSAPMMTDVVAVGTGGSSSHGVQNTSSSSPTMTNVTATAAGGTSNNYGVFNFSSSPSMNNVTATGTGGGFSAGVYNFTETAPESNISSSSPSMSNVTATGTGGFTSVGVMNSSLSSPTMTNVMATGTGGTDNYGVYNSAWSSPSMSNVTATGTATAGGGVSRGVFNTVSSLATIRNSSIAGVGESVYNLDGGAAKIADSTLDGAVAGGGFTCVGVHNTAFVELSTTCT